MKKLLLVIFALGLSLTVGAQAEAATSRSVIINPNINNRVITSPTPSPTPTSTPSPQKIILPKTEVIRRTATPSSTPTPATLETTPAETFSGIGGLELRKIGQETWLNPQPEPPIPAVEIKKMNQAPAQITSDKSVFLEKMKFTLAKNKVPLIGEITAETKENKTLYLATVSMPAKLFGLIPITLTEKIAMSEGTVPTINKPWYAKFSQEKVNLVSSLKVLPNLVVKGIRLEPAQFKEGDKVNVIATIANDGPGLAVGFPDVITYTGGPTEVLRWLDEGSSAYSWYPVFVYLEPGKTEEMAIFYVNSVKCGENMSYEIAKSDTSHIEEMTKEDNVLQFKLDCNQ
ncbi:MAG: hypothetical protein M1308_21820 [Actinobacteria bacterium]|nr:hypothetical protein [Actinomycetota bacterium]